MHYCFTLSEEQLEYLRSKKYKIDRMECFMSLVTLAERETKLVPLNKTQQVEILRGQFMVDNTQLARLWNKDKEGSASDSDNSHHGNMGMNPSASGEMPHPSPPSNDSGNVGKSMTIGNSSNSPQYNKSH